MLEKVKKKVIRDNVKEKMRGLKIDSKDKNNLVELLYNLDKGNLYDGMTLDKDRGGHFHFFKKFKIPEIENLGDSDQKRTVGIFTSG